MSVFSFQRDWQKVYFGKNPLERDVPTLRVNAYQISFKSKVQMVMRNYSNRKIMFFVYVAL